MPNSYAATNTKKFLDANGLAHFAQRLNQYPTNEVIEAVVDGIQDALDEKINISEKDASNGVAPLDANRKVPLTNLPAMNGANSSQAGSAGIVPAPTSLDSKKYLKGDGTWGEPGGSSIYQFTLDNMANASGVYSHSTTIPLARASMKAVNIECSNPDAFLDAIAVTISNGSILVECNNVLGSSTISVTAAEQDNGEELTVTQYDLLIDKIGDITNLSTTNKSSLTMAVNELNNNKIDKPTSVAAGKFLQTDSNGNAVWSDAASPTDVANAVTNWLDDNIPAGQTVAVDQSLTVSGAAADAKKTGDQLSDLKSAFNTILNGNLYSAYPYYKYTEWTGTRWNKDRLMIIKDYIPKIGLKKIVLNRTNSGVQKLHLIEQGETEFRIVKTYEATPVDGVATFYNVFTYGKYLIGFQSDTGTYGNPSESYVIPVYSGWPSNLAISSFSVDTSYAVDIEIIEYRYNVINPDDYDGTDDEKIQQAFNALQPTGGVINIGRTFKLTTQILISHVYSANHKIYVNGISSDAGFYLSTYGSYFRGTAGNTGGVIFTDLKFYGKSNVANQRVLSPGYGSIGSEDHEAFVHCTFERCVISNIEYIVEGAHYLQSLWLINCVIREVGSLISTGGGIWYGTNILHCIIEGCGRIGSIYYPEAVNIVNNCIEGCSKIPILISTQSASVRIEGNYFEGNDVTGGSGTSISMNGMPAERTRNVRIVNNYFYIPDNKYAINLPQTGLSDVSGMGAILIENNSVLGGGYLVGGNDETTYNEVVCMLNSGSVSNLPLSTLKVLTAIDINKLADL